MIKAIFLDLDNTLIDRDAAFLAYTQDFFLKNNMDLKPNSLNLILKKDNHGYTPRTDFCSWFIKTFNLKNWTAKQFWGDMKSKLANYIPPVEKAIIQHIETWQQQYIVAILSNGGSQNQRAKLQQAGLAPLFEESHLFISGDMGVSKPDALFFKMALERFDLQPQEAVMIGDDVRNDVEGAKAVGLRTVWVKNRNLLISPINSSMSHQVKVSPWNLISFQ